MKNAQHFSKCLHAVLTPSDPNTGTANALSYLIWDWSISVVVFFTFCVSVIKVLPIPHSCVAVHVHNTKLILLLAHNTTLFGSLGTPLWVLCLTLRHLNGLLKLIFLQGFFLAFPFELVTSGVVGNWILFYLGLLVTLLRLVSLCGLNCLLLLSTDSAPGQAHATPNKNQTKGSLT